MLRLRLWRRPMLSVVVVVYNMRREAPRTLYSLSPAYQRDIDPGDYEVIVMENGSSEPLSESLVRGMGPVFFYRYLHNALPSPARAVNLGAKLARGKYLGILIDGARICTPGLLAQALLALRAIPGAVVGSLGYHLGPKAQQESVTEGYSKTVEDELLRRVRWQEDGYRLYLISSLAGSSQWGCFGLQHGTHSPINETNSLFLDRKAYSALSGLDEAFDLPGGGYVNLDIFKRACERDGARLAILLGEGTFHQTHGGASTDIAQQAAPWERYERQYIELRRQPWAAPQCRVDYFGAVSSYALPMVRASAELAMHGLGDTGAKVSLPLCTRLPGGPLDDGAECKPGLADPSPAPTVASRCEG